MGRVKENVKEAALMAEILICTNCKKPKCINCLRSKNLTKIIEIARKIRVD